MNRATKVLFWMILITGILAGAAFYTYYHYFKPNDEVIPAFDEGKLVLVIEGEQDVSAQEPKIVKGEILLPFSVVKKYFDKNIYWDEALNIVSVTTENRVIRMKTDSLDALVNNKPMKLKIPVIKESGQVYVPIEFLSDLYGIDISYVESSNVIIIDYKNKDKQVAQPISPDALIRKGHTIRYPIIRKLDMNSANSVEKEMRVFGEYDKWYKVRTWDGAIGYIEKRFVEVKSLVTEEMAEEGGNKSDWKPEKGKVNLVWDQIYQRRDDLSDMDNIEGLDVISPTWFQLKNAEGELINRAYAKYVDWAHGNGYKVWALLANDFNDHDMSSQLLNNTNYRDNLIKEVLAYSALYKLDGINIDFENMYNSDRDAFTQFVREITPFLKEQGLVVSVDVNDIECYDKKALSEVVDYVMYMSYDQHWRTSPIAGSVAQLTWVEERARGVIENENVPAEKLLLGIPFYTRLWTETTDEVGNKSLDSKALSMEDARNTVLTNNAKVEWDEESGQFYGQYQKENTINKIWLEEVNSINLKASLVHKYKLAGTCAWSSNFVATDIWGVLKQDLKEISNYQEWLNQNKDKKYVYK
ncbi:glycosyl hydrolase family 18 protein [Acetivibrio cellulolyticus]|uniref:glycosyl hydrolase family 18 protein n=1 Tax=Acetivibrio cellulolyticus TaxID=35830 RepID=UPI0001E2BE63|nr:glycosyl hydrolase family 18 protein [Acetivibrio cellulolyticus]